ncbi:uncharacterized protein BJ171DRAFT_585837 [Polychytrium aggregatum]|uniref:uncharacterized protein n=1 Tax=Polychytrium aggregatum TaxID=110093 RepID=UPI0022FF0073|nr:uncharacterized protein BJ171DRAFT_585837 [Polychytrium aggregatum]KAI9197317.1 hypothetical protein BJ171DRAFT_585837 [Polychytrium aggregatum]
MGKKGKGKKGKQAEDPALDLPLLPTERVFSEQELIVLNKRIAKAFETFDQASNNTCDVREVGTIIRSLGIYPTEEQLRNYIKDMSEEEPTGYVTYDKFLNVAMGIFKNPSCRRDDQEQLFRAFLTLDVDKKGYLLPEELKTALMSDGEAFSQEEINEMLLACTDPTEGKIYYEDYVAVLAEK